MHAVVVGCLLTLPSEGAVPLKVGDMYRIYVKEEMSGFLNLPEKPGAAREQFKISGQRESRYRERILPLGRDGTAEMPDRVLRKYDRLSSRRKVKDDDQKGFDLRPEIRHIVFHRGEAFAKPWSPDGPMRFEEVHTVSHQIFVPALNGLLPKGAWKVGEKWAVDRRTVAELCGFLPVQKGGLTCEIEGQQTGPEGQPLLRIHFTGVIDGISEEGQARDDVEGRLYIHADTGVMHSINIAAERLILNTKKEVDGKIEVSFRLSLQKQTQDADLSDELASGLPIEPSEKQTAILYEYPPEGLRLVHPRRWTLSLANGSRLEFQQSGNAIVFNAEPDDATPSIKKYASDVKTKLDNDDFKVESPYIAEPQEQKDADRRWGYFEVKVSKGKDPYRLQYWVYQDGHRGLTAMGTFKEDQFDAKNFRNDIVGILKSVEFTRPTRNPPAKKDAAKR